MNMAVLISPSLFKHNTGLEGVPRETSRSSLQPADREEVLGWMDPEGSRDVLVACWELEFLPVAQKLMTFLHPDAFVETCI